jgi:DeoR/GlpR family transcriptional regulator of sugar metabolism
MEVLTEERRQRILKFIDENGAASVAELRSLMDVSPMTIRRDLIHLSSQGLVIRTHGGAVSPRESTTSEFHYEVKTQIHVKEKQRIGLAAAKMVNDGETVILDSGSTTFQIARNLKAKRNLMVVTNDLMIASHLSEANGISVILIGGSMRHRMFSTVGPYAEEMLREFSVDKTFLSADAVHIGKGVLNTTPQEVPIKRLMIEAAQEVVLVVDHSKFDKLGLSFVCNISDVDKVLTDEGIRPELSTSLKEQGVTLEIC